MRCHSRPLELSPEIVLDTLVLQGNTPLMQRTPAPKSPSKTTLSRSFKAPHDLLERADRVVSLHDITFSQLVRNGLKRELQVWERKGAA